MDFHCAHGRTHLLWDYKANREKIIIPKKSTTEINPRMIEGDRPSFVPCIPKHDFLGHPKRLNILD